MVTEKSASLTPLRRLLLVTLALVLAGAIGCGDEADPMEPDGAYDMFRDAMLSGDAQGVWETTDPKTHAYFEDRYAQLVEMDETIKRYLPQTDHKLARQQSGTELLDEVDDGKGLFLKVYRPENLPETSEEGGGGLMAFLGTKTPVEVGSDVAEVKVAEDETMAKIVTRAGQEYVLVRPNDEEKWRVRLSQSSKVLDQAFGWLDANDKALQQTVEDLIAEERKEREAVIAELMGLEKK